MAFENMNDEEFHAAVAAMSDDEVNEARVLLDLEIQNENARLAYLNAEHGRRDAAAHNARQLALVNQKSGEPVIEGQAVGDIPVVGVE